eukprot:jgi/Picsp_1/4821/NSC_02188-R1_protein
MEKFSLSSDEGYTAEVYRHGCHVTKWCEPDGTDIIFLSDKAVFEPPKAIRGGIPICFPQFGDFGPVPTQHGFARNSGFQVVERSSSTIEMKLSDKNMAFCKDFPHSFELYVRVSALGSSLLQQARVLNTGESSFEFSFAFHTYFALQSGIENAGIRNMRDLSYLDSLQNRIVKTESESVVKFNGEVDRIYLHAPHSMEVIDGSKRIIEIKKSGLNDAVLWNPFVEKSASLKDFGDDEWRSMVCCECTQAGSGMINLEPGKEWQGYQRLTRL